MRWTITSGTPTISPTSSSPLYEIDDVEAALGIRIGAEDDGYAGDPEERATAGARDGSWDTEHQKRLGAILDRGRGDAGAARSARMPARSTRSTRSRPRRRTSPRSRTPVRRHLRAALNTGGPTALPNLLLVGEPGIGKTFFLSRLARLLGLPFRSYSMAAATLGEGLQGSHPTWRNAQPGLVAQTLLHEEVGNPVIFVDELDKAQEHAFNGDPYRPFYGLLDPSGAADFTDEFLKFRIDARRVNWVLASNALVDAIPPAVIDRLTVIEVPSMSDEQFVAVAASVYAEANAAKRGYFSPELGADVVRRLAGLNARGLRIALEDAMVTAAAEGRRVLTALDVRPRRPSGPRRSASNAPGPSSRSRPRRL